MSNSTGFPTAICQPALFSDSCLPDASGCTSVSVHALPSAKQQPTSLAVLLPLPSLCSTYRDDGLHAKMQPLMQTASELTSDLAYIGKVRACWLCCAVLRCAATCCAMLCCAMPGVTLHACNA